MTVTEEREGRKKESNTEKKRKKSKKEFLISTQNHIYVLLTKQIIHMFTVHS